MKFTPLLLTPLLLFSMVAFADWEGRVGMEFEYRSTEVAQPFTHLILQRKLLQIVQENFSSETSILSQPWERYTIPQGDNAYFSTYVDEDHRTWTAVPEQMTPQSAVFDGFELVTPPLYSEDLFELESTLQKIAASPLFAKGPQSSTHYTYEVSSLTRNPEDFSRIVDLILFIENHMLEIFNAVGPQRLGRHMNGYIIPLGLNQKELLYELAALPHQRRTREKVRDVFLRYQEREIRLFQNESSSAWKFRSVNYAKLLGLGVFTYELADLIEFRIADLVTSQDLRKWDYLFRKILETGSQTPQREFLDPFRSIPEFSSADLGHQRHNNVDALIHNLSAARYLSFLKKIGLDFKYFPKKYQGTLSFSDENIVRFPRNTTERRVLRCIDLLN